MPISTPSVVYTTLVCTLLNLSAWAQVSTPPPSRPSATRHDSLRRVYQAEHLRRIRDPALDRVPTERLSITRQQLGQSLASQRSARSGSSTAQWTERGPLGYTGTLRTFLIDPADSTGRRVWGGSTTGGLWVHPDVANPAARWQSVSNTWPSQAISALANDPLNKQTLYATTGDYGDDTPGGGIWKSTDGGATWAVLPATVPGQPGTSVTAAFRTITGLLVTKTGLLVAGTTGGVLRSADKGQTWQTVLAPQQDAANQTPAKANLVSAIRLGKNGLVYTAMATGQLFRSTTGAATSWTDITPPNAVSASSFRTELIVADTANKTGNILYAAQVAKAGTGYTLRWLQKSADNGTTWQAMTRPTYPDVPDLDVTLGFGDTYFTLNTDPDSTRTLYLTAYDRLYQSDDGGKSWSTGQFIGRTTAYLPMGKQEAVWGSDNSVLYDKKRNPTDNQPLDPSVLNRTAGFGGLVATGVAQPNNVASAVRLVGNAGEPGLLETPGPDGTPESVQVSYPAYPLRPFIDQDEPTIQVATTTNGGFLTRNTDYSTSWDYFSAGVGAGDFPDGGIDYDSRANTLFFWSGTYRKATGIGTDPVISALSSGTLARPTCLKVGASANTLFVATVNGDLYKWTKLDQNAPLLTKLDAGVFPVGSSISSIDVGRNDSLLVVTLANYGVSSVWSTTNGGATWQNRDLPNSGLPDMPVYAARINPRDPKQVMLATELGIWSTADITADSPGWMRSGTTVPLVRFTQLTYRPTDGHLVAASAGRGLWETDVWAPAPPALMAGALSATVLCAGSTFPVAFTLTNAPATTVQVRLSDATGNFSNGVVVGSGSSSPLLATLPASVVTGNRYVLRLEAASLTTTLSNTFTVNNLRINPPQLLDRRHTLDARLATGSYRQGYVCPGDSALLRAYIPGPPDATATFQWAIDGQIISRQTAATLLTGQTGTYSFTVTSGGCTATNATDLLLISSSKLTASVLTPASAGDGPTCLGLAIPLASTYLGQRGNYQWLRNGLPVGGATSPTLSATETGLYTYSLTAGSSGTCAVTAVGSYLAFSKTTLPPSIALVNNTPPTLCGNEALSLYALSQPDSATYQWLRNGLPIADMTTPATVIYQSGIYSLRVLRRGGCSAVSNPITITGRNQLSNGIYYYGSTSVCTGETLMLYAKNTRHTLQWTKDGVAIPGATGLSYPADASGRYALQYVTGTCSGTSVSVSVVVSQTLNPSVLVTSQCTSADLSTRDFPPGQVTFSWLRNNQLVSQGSQAYQTVTESGPYSLSVTNGVCSGVSAPVSISIGQPSRPIIRAIGGPTGCPNSAVELERVSGPASYWTYNGTALAGRSTERLVAAEAGIYSLVYEQGKCLTESAALTVVINQPVSASALAKPFIKAGQVAVVPIQLTGVGPWSFSITGFPALSNSGQNPYSFTVAPGSSTSYTMVSLANGCGPGTGTTWRVVVGGADVSLSSWVDKRVGPPGSTITYLVRVQNAGPDVAENITLVNRLPPGMSYVAGQTPTPADTLSYTLPRLNPNQAVILSFQARSTRQGTYLNSVEVLACDTPDPDSKPGTGTNDGEDDATTTDFRTAFDTLRQVFRSPNPYGQVLPVVAGNQPVPIANKADLSLQLFLDKRIVSVQRRDTVRVTMQVRNRGAAATSYVQLGISIPNGLYSLDKRNWLAAGPNKPVDLGPVGQNDVVSRTIFWIPNATGSCLAEVISSTLPDPNSTPNNHAARPGEDDEAVADIRVLR